MRSGVILLTGNRKALRAYYSFVDLKINPARALISFAVAQGRAQKQLQGYMREDCVLIILYNFCMGGAFESGENSFRMRAVGLKSGSLSPFCMDVYSS